MNSALKTTLGHTVFNMKISSRTVTNIEVCTLKDYEKVRKKFVEVKIAFYTYTTKGKLPDSLVLKGLSDTFDERVSEYIKALKINILETRWRQIAIA